MSVSPTGLWASLDLVSGKNRDVILIANARGGVTHPDLPPTPICHSHNDMWGSPRLTTLPYPVAPTLDNLLDSISPFHLHFHYFHKPIRSRVH